MQLIMTETHAINLDEVESVVWEGDTAYIAFRTGRKEVVKGTAARRLYRALKRVAIHQTDTDPFRSRPSMNHRTSEECR